MNAVQEILSFTRNPDEDYYGLLGCDRSANDEQIVAEFKARVRGCHPDKQNNADCKDFQALLEVRTCTYTRQTCVRRHWGDPTPDIGNVRHWLMAVDEARCADLPECKLIKCFSYASENLGRFLKLFLLEQV